MKLRSAVVTLIGSLSVGCLVPALLAQSDKQPIRIVVGPNILVSREQDGNMGELFVAADPLNAPSLVGSGIHFNGSQPTGFQGTRVYHSDDRGSSWTTFSEGALSGDPIVAYGRTGTAYFLSGALEGTKGKSHFYRSEDGGSTWLKPVLFDFSDRQFIVVDRSSGRFDGRVYVTGLYEGPHGNFGRTPDGHIGLWYSNDDGRTWLGPNDIADSHDLNGRRVQTLSWGLFSNGDLFIPYVIFPAGKEASKQDQQRRFRFVLSQDGGMSFSPAQKFTLGSSEEIVPHNTDNFVFAVDNSESRFRDRLYMVWTNGNFDWPGEEPGDLLISYSSDRGKTWSNPKVVPAASSTGSGFGPPSIAVNRDGAVAVSWYSSQGRPTGFLGFVYDRYITVSLDGGETFLSPVRVSSVSTDASALERNFAGAQANGNTVSVINGAMSHGEYQGLIADNEGVFHEFWTDGRTGRTQIWTATVRVAGLGSVEDGRPPLVEADVSDKVEAWLDPPNEFPPAGTIEIPVRLRNISTQPIYGPMTIEIVQYCGNPCGSPTAKGTNNTLASRDPILNSINGKSGVGATFDYSHALGNAGLVQPGEITDAVAWRLKKTTVGNEYPSMTFKVKAFLRQSTTDR
jgi:hypothetical protein